MGNTTEPAKGERTNYLNADYGAKSWLLTTDHKRIALLYLISISVFFLLGGLMAVLIRLELATPAGDLVQPDTYNRLFTMHGILMIFFFLIPSIPAVFGNFLIPLMIGAKDLAFPRSTWRVGTSIRSEVCSRCGHSYRAVWIPDGLSTLRSARLTRTPTSLRPRWGSSLSGSRRS